MGWVNQMISPMDFLPWIKSWILKGRFEFPEKEEIKKDDSSLVLFRDSSTRQTRRWTGRTHRIVLLRAGDAVRSHWSSLLLVESPESSSRRVDASRESPRLRAFNAPDSSVGGRRCGGLSRHQSSKTRNPTTTTQIARILNPFCQKCQTLRK